MDTKFIYNSIKYLLLGSFTLLSIHTYHPPYFPPFNYPGSKTNQKISENIEREHSNIKKVNKNNIDIEKLYKESGSFKQINQIYPTYIDLFIRYAKIREDIYKVEEALHLPHNILSYLFFVESRYDQKRRSKAGAYGISQITYIAYRDISNKYHQYKKILKRLLDEKSYEKVMKGEILDWKDTENIQFKAHISFSNNTQKIIAKEIIPLFLSRTINLLHTYNLSTLPSWEGVKKNPIYNILAGAIFYNLKYLYNINLQAIRTRDGKIKLILRSYKHFEKYGENLRFFDPYTIYILYNSVDAFKYKLVRKGFSTCRIDYLHTKKGKIMDETLIGLYNMRFAQKVIKKLEKLYTFHQNLLFPLNKEEYKEIMKIFHSLSSLDKKNLSKIKKITHKHTS